MQRKSGVSSVCKRPSVGFLNHFFVPSLGTKIEYVFAKVSDHITTLEYVSTKRPKAWDKIRKPRPKWQKLHTLKPACIHCIH